MKERQRIKRRLFVGIAQMFADLSTCKRDKVGCLVCPSDLTRIDAVGYNGPPAGEDNDSCTGEIGQCGCIHAEANALLKLYVPRRKLTLVTTRSPCRHCSGLIINSGNIDEVVYGHKRSELDRLSAAGIRVWTVKEWCDD